MRSTGVEQYFVGRSLIIVHRCQHCCGGCLRRLNNDETDVEPHAEIVVVMGNRVDKTRRSKRVCRLSVIIKLAGRQERFGASIVAQ